MILDFTGIDEASETQEKLKEGNYLVTVTKAEEKISKNNNQYWAMEYTIKSGQFQDKVIKDNTSITEKSLGRIKRMYSRILNIQLDSKHECKPQEFLGRSCMVEVKQVHQEASGTFHEGYRAGITFAGFYSVSDYNIEMDKELSHCEGYLKHLEDKKDESKKDESGSGSTGFGPF